MSTYRHWHQAFFTLFDISGEEDAYNRAGMNEVIRGDDSGHSSTWQVYLDCIDRLNRKCHQVSLTEAPHKARLIKAYQHEFEQAESSRLQK
jgi:hypothetical protein